VRQKITDSGLHVQTVRGVGYKLAPDANGAHAA
jgi:DNA-binding response OmpR family regulator